MIIRYPDRIEELRVVMNTDDSQVFSNVSANTSRGLPKVEMTPAIPEPAVLCGGGPSLGDPDSLEKIERLQKMGAKVYALNNAARFLCEHGIRPDYQVVIDPREQNAAFVDHVWADEILLASQCSPKTFDAALAAGAKVRLWHCGHDGIAEHIKGEPGDKALLVGGGPTVGMSAMSLAYALGHSIMHLFGYDSCNEHGKSHAYEQAMNEGQDVMRVAVDNEVFYASTAMTAQARKFPMVAQALTEKGCEIEVHGRGLLPHIAKMMVRDVRPLTAIYDLASAPPTFDFLSFLSQADAYRIEKDLTCIDVVFAPGPIHGFRDDDLPPDAIEREAMLHRVCVAATRLLPTVRCVTVLRQGERPDISGPVFPEGWKPDVPLSVYGAQYLKGGHRCLTATAAAKREIKKRFGLRAYVTITLRNAEYWPERNSDEKAWQAAAWELARRGYEVVWVYDTADARADGYAFDLDLRLALYEGAAANLGVMNGPMALCFLSEAKYLVWKPIAGAYGESMYTRFGITPGDQYGDNGMIFWEEDTADNLLRGIDQFFGIRQPIAVNQ